MAHEGALKIKETCYLHAEGYSGGALKHGPFALIEDHTGKFGATPILMIILDDNHAHHMRTAAEEVRARGADLIIITDKPSLAADLTDKIIPIPSNGPMTALGAVLPLQLIAYELALLRYASWKRGAFESPRAFAAFCMIHSHWFSLCRLFAVESTPTHQEILPKLSP